MFHDDRQVRAPLPAITDGSVVEYEIKVREHKPFFERGASERIEFFGDLPQSVRIVVETPSNVTLRTVLAEIPPEAKSEAAAQNGRKRVSIVWTPQRVVEENEQRDWSRPSAYFAFSTGDSWQRVASGYEEIIERVLASSDVRTLTAGIGLAEVNHDTAALAARLASRLHETVRYTGVEFGEAAIVPVTSSVVMERRFGDCKDKAAMLVAMLRSFGIKAHIALLQAGIGVRDADESLPGLGMFNHAIVYVPGERPLWIDATADTTRIPDLPPSDQGRLALIASAATDKLVRTPEAQSSANRHHEIEMRLPPSGKGTVTERVRATGSFESGYREMYSGRTEEDKKQFEAFAKDIYLSSTVGAFDTPARTDFTKPYQFQFEVLNSGRAPTEGDEAAAGLFYHFLFENLPWELRAVQKPKQTLKVDWVLSQAYQAEYKYVVYPPPGFSARALPKSERLQWGPASFEQAFRKLDSGAVEAVFRFDSGKRRYTPAEAEIVRGGVSGHSDGKPLVVSFVSESAEAAALGDLRRALASAIKLIEATPKSAGPRIRLAKLLLQVGAGAAAREEARKAIEIDPQSSQAQQALGWAYQHDSFGRRFKGDWNPMLAADSYRKAIELDKSDSVPSIDLAILLEHNASGVRYGKGCQCDQAEAIYRKTLSDSENPNLRNNLAALLLRTGKYDALEKELPKLGVHQPEYVTLLTAIREGAGRAVLTIQQQFPDPAARGQQLLVNARTLLGQRFYAPAVDLFKAANRLLNNAQLSAQLERMSKLRRREDIQLDSKDPQSVARRLMVTMFDGDVTVAGLKPLFTRSEDFSSSNSRETIESLRRQRASIVGAALQAGLPEDVFVDLMASTIDFETKGDDETAIRVTAGAGPGHQMTLYVVKEEGEYRIFGGGDVGGLDFIAERILGLANAGDLDKARKWLDLVVEQRESDALGRNRSAFALLWSGVKPETRGKPEILLAAAAMLGQAKASPKAITLLEQGLPKAPTQVERNQILIALAQAHEKAANWRALLDIATKLDATSLFSSDALRYRLEAFEKLGQWTEIDRLAGPKAGEDRENTLALRALAAGALARHDDAKTLEYNEALGSAMTADEEDRLRAAWALLRIGKGSTRIVAKLTESNAVGQSADHYYALGLLQIADGSVDTSVQALINGLNRDDAASLDAQPWVLQGKILLSVGLQDKAAAAFASAKSTNLRTSDRGNWARELAARH